MGQRAISPDMHRVRGDMHLISGEGDDIHLICMGVEFCDLNGIKVVYL